MVQVLRRRDQRKGAIAAAEFEGGEYGAGFSFFVGTLAPGGNGPRPHRHPYAEVCIVRSGQAAMIVDGEQVIAGAGDIVVLGPGACHCFSAIGDERLDMVCIHASDRFIIEWTGTR
jgi:mannose-6-phosphate isomerase-like protein (cupin superfamily)